jgi:hypothetical protein
MPNFTDHVDSAPRLRALTRVVLGALALTAACEVPSIPSDPPAIDIRWVVPAPTTRIAVASILPSGVTILSDSSGFTVSLPTANVTRTLGQDCGTCIAFNGTTAPKPAFTGTASMSSNLPADIASATLTGGTLAIVVNNNYTFDPIRPNGTTAPFGFAVITVTNNGVQIGKDSVNGADLALPSGGSISRSINLSGTITGTAPVVVTLTLNSPAGNPVLIDASRTISVSATPTNIRVASANVAVANKSISSTSSFNLADIDKTISDKVQSGALLFTVTNPFNVSGTLTVRLTPDNGAPINKTVQLTAGNSTPSISFTQQELRSLLGHNVTVLYTGTVNSASGSINVTPKQAVIVASKLDVSLEVGG